MKKILVIDNFDSFTYNLVQLLRELEDVQVDVVRNNAIPTALDEIYDLLLLSPGPGIPEEAGDLLQVIADYAGKMPILGVCLGHQALAIAFGGKLQNLSEVYHGVATEIHLTTQNEALFAGMQHPFLAGRYHSWVVDPQYFPENFVVTATAADGAIMAMRHRKWPLQGLQFHPESILTPMGRQILSNWVQASGQIHLSSTEKL
jgi:anthranilate synthase component II